MWNKTKDQGNLPNYRDLIGFTFCLGFLIRF